MTPGKKLAIQTARKLLARLPLPIATPVELQRAAPAPNPKSLAFKRIALIGRGAADSQELSDYLQEQGGRVEVGAQPGAADVLIAVLPERPGYDELHGLHATLAPHVAGLAGCGRVLLVARACGPMVAGGLHGFVRSLGRELGRKGATVNAVLSESWQGCCPVAAFLVSDRASYISGQSFALAAGAAPAGAQPAVRLAVVTGAAQGIGASIAKVLAASGCRLALIDVPSQAEAGQAVCDQLGGEPAGMAFFACDVRDDSAVESALERARSLSPFGSIDVLVNNAGITRDRTFARMSAAEWSDVLSVNLSAVMHVTRRAAPRLAPGARVIHVSSVTGLAGNFGQTNYAAAKGALIGLSAQAARELEGRGIAVTAIAPGFIDTAMTEQMPALQREIARQMISLAQPGLPLDVAMAVEFLARREGWPLRGQAVRVDGGMYFGP
jgi:3-oxoacyl-[acyl-carrier protein] reductase